MRILLRGVLFIVALLAATSAMAGQRVALVIGNSAYQVPKYVLPNPRNDANAIAEALQKAGFDKVMLRNDLDQAQFREALGEFAQSAAGADIALIYYAGHGAEVGGTN